MNTDCVPSGKLGFIAPCTGSESLRHPSTVKSPGDVGALKGNPGVKTWAITFQLIY